MFKLKVDKTMKCFGCGREGHLIQRSTVQPTMTEEQHSRGTNRQEEGGEEVDKQEQGGGERE